MKRLTRGFTLIEILVVIAVIGVVATIGLGGYVTTQKRSRDAKRIGDLQTLSTAQEQYYAIEGEYADMGDVGQECDMAELGSILNTIPEPPRGGSTGDWEYKCDRDDEPDGINSFCIAVRVETGTGNCYGCACNDNQETCEMELVAGPPPMVEGLQDQEGDGPQIGPTATDYPRVIPSPTINDGNDEEPTPTRSNQVPTVGTSPGPESSGFTHYCIISRQ